MDPIVFSLMHVDNQTACRGVPVRIDEPKLQSYVIAFSAGKSGGLSIRSYFIDDTDNVNTWQFSPLDTLEMLRPLPVQSLIRTQLKTERIRDEVMRELFELVNARIAELGEGKIKPIALILPWQSKHSAPRRPIFLGPQDDPPPLAA